MSEFEQSQFIFLLLRNAGLDFINLFSSPLVAFESGSVPWGLVGQVPSCVAFGRLDILLDPPYL